MKANGKEEKVEVEKESRAPEVMKKRGGRIVGKEEGGKGYGGGMEANGQ